MRCEAKTGCGARGDRALLGRRRASRHQGGCVTRRACVRGTEVARWSHRVAGSENTFSLSLADAAGLATVGLVPARAAYLPHTVGGISSTPRRHFVCTAPGGGVTRACQSRRYRISH